MACIEGLQRGDVLGVVLEQEVRVVHPEENYQTALSPFLPLREAPGLLDHGRDCPPRAPSSRGPHPILLYLIHSTFHYEKKLKGFRT